ncbi:hypothetical protein ACFY2R_09685 [Micromonospora olivasterospora]|nr:hypothetical protein [Micromonospora olivasterospora]
MSGAYRIAGSSRVGAADHQYAGATEFVGRRTGETLLLAARAG